MVNRAARAVGIANYAGGLQRFEHGVAMASISGTRCGCSLLNQRLELGGVIVMVRE
jgi:hypothetical protein